VLPAFHSRGNVLTFGALIAGLLVLPVLVPIIGMPSREQVWSSTWQQSAGPIGVIVRTSFLDETDADILILGSSVTLDGYRADVLERKISGLTGQKVECRVFGIPDSGQDAQYLALRDYLDRHRAKLVVIEVPRRVSESPEPQFLTYRLRRFGEDKDGFSGLGAGYAVQSYGEFVLGGPLQLLERVRPNQLGVDEVSDQAPYRTPVAPERRVCIGDKPFVEDSLTPSETGQARALSFGSSELRPVGPSAYRTTEHFIKLMTQMAASHGARVVLQETTEEVDYGHSYLPVPKGFEQSFSQYKVIGIPETELFKDLPRERVDHFYADTMHFNANGATAFSNAIAPALASELVDPRAG
jgi:hypothetical protein